MNGCGYHLDRPPVLLPERTESFTCEVCHKPGWGPPGSKVHPGGCRLTWARANARRNARKRRAKMKEKMAHWRTLQAEAIRKRDEHAAAAEQFSGALQAAQDLIKIFGQ